jgi:hypothetical protein
MGDEVIELGRALRSHAESWFGAQNPTLEEIALRIQSVARQLGALDAYICRYGAWFVVGATMDWLRAVEGDGEALFDHTIPIPGVVNSMRPESWLTAFATDVAMGSGTRRWLVTGDRAALAVLTRQIQSNWTRAICFR